MKLILTALRDTGLIMIVFVVCGCTDKITYERQYRDFYGNPQKVRAVYVEGIGNSTKTAVEARIHGEMELSVGNSTTDQAVMLETMQEISALLYELLERYP